MIIQTTKVRRLFNDSGIQVSKYAMEMLNRDYERRIQNMIENVKWCNVRRLKNSTFWSIYRRTKAGIDNL